jgi:hypothetical protein
MTEYVSPVEKAREIVAYLRSGEGRSGGGHAKISRSVASSSRRIAKMAQMAQTVIDDLESVEAPLMVIRWVAWGDDPTECRRRADLVLYLRTILDTARGGWPREPHLQAALDLWQRAVAEAIQRGLMQPAPDDLPAVLYRDALAGVVRCSRRSPTPTKVPAATTLTDEERETLAGLLRRASPEAPPVGATNVEALTIEQTLIEELERAEAPLAIVRWVAWGHDATERRRRADLVLYLRTSPDTSQRGWPREPQLRAAFDVWQRASAAPRLTDEEHAALVRALRRTDE